MLFCDDHCVKYKYNYIVILVITKSTLIDRYYKVINISYFSNSLKQQFKNPYNIKDNRDRTIEFFLLVDSKLSNAETLIGNFAFRFIFLYGGIFLHDEMKLR